MMIHRHDRHEPNQTSQPLTMYALRPTFFLPNSKMPRKLDSRKNANSASAASGAPKMSPTNLE